MDISLVLNKLWIPVHVTGWERAITLLYSDRAMAIDEDYKMYNFNDWTQVSKMKAEANQHE